MQKLYNVLPSAERDRVVGLVAEAIGEEPRLILSRSRDPIAAQARWACWLYFHRQGYDTAAICLAFDRIHSTVLYGIHHANASPALCELAAMLEAGTFPIEPPPLLRRYGPTIARSVLAYLWLLTEGAAPPADALAGLRLIARNPCLQQDVACVLSARRRGHHYWRIKIHAAQLGVPWVELSTGVNVSMGQMVSRTSLIR